MLVLMQKELQPPPTRVAALQPMLSKMRVLLHLPMGVALLLLLASSLCCVPQRLVVDAEADDRALAAASRFFCLAW